MQKTFQISSVNDLPPLESFQIQPDVLKAANEKITVFEQENAIAVDLESIVGDEEYIVGEKEVDLTGLEQVP